MNYTLINEHLAHPDGAFTVHGVIDCLPKLQFADRPVELPLEFDPKLAQKYAEEQARQGRPDDAHVVVDSVGGFNISDLRPELRVAVVNHYSQLRADRHMDKRRIVGAANLVIEKSQQFFVMDQRISTVSTGGNTVHTFGGGYMPYRPATNEKSTRRDDRRDILRTARRELDEETSVQADSNEYEQNLAFVLEEFWVGKLGHLTFAFVLPLAKDAVFKSTWEGRIQYIPITYTNLLQMVVFGRTITKDVPDAYLKVHPQSRGLLYAWIQNGCRGLEESKKNSLQHAALLAQIQQLIDKK
jgi:8-oxo-dGTP pyrophosphatase MutT (NUDIX family)